MSLTSELEARIIQSIDEMRGRAEGLRETAGQLMWDSETIQIGYGLQGAASSLEHQATQLEHAWDQYKQHEMR